MQIGTLLRVGDAWRLIDSPTLTPEGQAETPPAGFFFQVSLANRPAAATAAAAGNDQAQKLLAELEKLDQSDPHRADLLEQIAESVKTAEERVMWYRQLADTISAAVQSGKPPEGDKRLEALFNKLQKNEADKPLAAYVRFRQLMAQYTLSQQAPKADFAKVQAEWLKTLEQYIGDYPTAPDTAEAMLQLGIAREFAGQEEDAKRWYGRVGQEFSGSPAAKKALVAATRLDCVGKELSLSGKSPSGETIDLAKYRGKVVLVQYWATWCGQSKADIPALKELASQVRRFVHCRGRQPRHEPAGPGDLPLREPLVLAADFRERRSGQPAGQRAGHLDAADDDPGGQGRQGGEPRHGAG